MNRLVATFKIDNGQATHAENDIAILKETMVIRPAVNNGISHAVHVVNIVLLTTPHIMKPSWQIPNNPRTKQVRDTQR
jgi:hypothetical protein